MTEDKIWTLITNTSSTINQSERDKVLATVLALWALKEKYEDYEDEWQMIARKAKNYLKSQGIQKVESIFKALNQVLAG